MMIGEQLCSTEEPREQHRLFSERLPSWYYSVTDSQVHLLMGHLHRFFLEYPIINSRVY